MTLLTEFLIGITFSGLVFVAVSYTVYRVILRPIGGLLRRQSRDPKKAAAVGDAGGAKEAAEHKEGALVERGQGVFEVVCNESQEAQAPEPELEYEMPSTAMTYEPLEEADADGEPTAAADAEAAEEAGAIALAAGSVDWSRYDAPAIYRVNPHWQPRFAEAHRANRAEPLAAYHEVPDAGEDAPLDWPELYELPAYGEDPYAYTNLPY